MDIFKIAKACHSVNKAICESQGDSSQVSWEDAPQWQKDSAINGVDFVLANPNAPASSNHENWLKVKEAEGWTYGPVKNPEIREHPCMVPYSELPYTQQVKDYAFRGVVMALSEYLK